MNAYGRVGSGARNRLLLAVPVVLVAVVVGVGLLAGAPEGRDRPGPGSSPASSPESVAQVSVPTTNAAATTCSDGGPGRAMPAQSVVVLGLAHAQVALALTEGWCRLGSGSGTWAARHPAPAGGSIGFTVNDNLPCVDGAVSPEYALHHSTDLVIDGYVGQRIEFSPSSACHPNTVLDALGDPGDRSPDTALTLWLLDVDGQRLATYVATSTQRGWRRLIESVDISALAPPDEATFPPAGELAPGYYVAVVDSNPAPSCCPNGGFGFAFRVPSAGWTSSGPGPGGVGGSISRGMVGSPDGAIIRWGNPERVYADPCAGILGPPIGESVGELAAAMAATPGVVVTGPTKVPLRWSTAQHVVLTIPNDLPCDPRSFGLWSDDVRGPRTVTAPGSRIEVWIFNPNDRPVFGRVVIEAETYPGVSPEVEREIEQIVASVDHGG